MTVIGVSYGLAGQNISDKKKIPFAEPVQEKKEAQSVKRDSVENKSNKGIPASTIKIAGEIALAVGNGISHSPKILNHSTKLISAGVPKAVGVLNYGIGVYDSYDFVKKTVSKDVSTLSKAFAAGTVGLDIIAILAHNKGNGKVAMVAGLVSIGTSLLSDKYEHKK